MSEAPILFGNRQQSGNAELAGASPFAVNVLVDGKGAVRRRPGISTWSGFPTTIPDASEVQGIQSFEDELYYVNAARRIHKVDEDGANTQLSVMATPSSLLEGTGRPVFTETPYRLVIAGGATPSKVDSTETLAEVLGGSPPDSDFIVWQASRLFSNDATSAATSSSIRFSATGLFGEEQWDALDYAEAEADPDSVVAIRANSNELHVFGSRSYQVFSPDPVAVIAPGRAQQLGLAAPHSVIRIDESFGLLDAQRRFLLTDGRAYEDISADMAATIDGIDTVTDAWGFRYSEDQFDCLVWPFPTDGRTFCWQRGGGWAQWQGWSTTLGGYTLFPAKSHFYWPEMNVHLVGLATGQIAKLDATANTDLGDIIKAEVKTGFGNQNTDDFKHCEAVRLVFKRGQSPTAPTVLLSWRDDLGEFCTPKRISLGVTGDYVQTVEIRSLGTYRSRQWKLEMTDAADLLLARATEVFSTGSDS
jgi:hypothetical protein